MKWNIFEKKQPKDNSIILVAKCHFPQLGDDDPESWIYSLGVWNDGMLEDWTEEGNLSKIEPYWLWVKVKAPGFGAGEWLRMQGRKE